jgi:parallel beta-helix repeat protein
MTDYYKGIFFDGLKFHQIKKKTINNNSFSDNNISIKLHNAKDICIEENILHNSQSYGITLSDSYEVTITKNILNQSRVAIHSTNGSEDTIIFLNSFYQNNINAETYGDCQWFSESLRYGNYWDDYEDKYPDATKHYFDKTYDTPYEPESGNQSDIYPLIMPPSSPYLHTVVKSGKALDITIHNLGFSDAVRPHVHYELIGGILTSTPISGNETYEGMLEEDDRIVFQQPCFGLGFTSLSLSVNAINVKEVSYNYKGFMIGPYHVILSDPVITYN